MCGCKARVHLPPLRYELLREGDPLLRRQGRVQVQPLLF